MNVPVLCLRIHKLYTRSRRNDEIVSGLGNVAAMVKPVGINVGWKLLLNLTGMEIASSEDTAVFTCRQRGRTTTRPCTTIKS